MSQIFPSLSDESKFLASNAMTPFFLFLSLSTLGSAAAAAANVDDAGDDAEIRPRSRRAARRNNGIVAEEEDAPLRRRTEEVPVACDDDMPGTGREKWRW